MRILHIISGIDPQNGGPTTALARLAEAQVRQGLEVTIISTWQRREAFDTAKALESQGVRVQLIGPARGKLSRHPQIKPTLMQHIAATDVVHIHAVWEEIQYQAGRLAQRMGTPYIITPHGMLDPWNMSRRGWLKRVYLALRLRSSFDHAAALHCTTAIEEQWVRQYGFGSSTFVEPLGIDLREFTPPPARGVFRCAHPEIGDRKIIVYLGRIHRGKGLELLVPALAQADVPEAMLVVIGPDSFGFQATVESMIAEHRLQDRVLFTGMLNGTARLLPLADAALLALPSFHENFGLAVVEALAMGCPVVVSDQVNLHREIAAAGVGLVTPTEVPALAAALRRYLRDEGARSAAAGRAVAFARAHFDLEQIAAHWVEHYRRVARESSV